MRAYMCVCVCVCVCVCMHEGSYQNRTSAKKEEGCPNFAALFALVVLCGVM